MKQGSNLGKGGDGKGLSKLNQQEAYMLEPYESRKQDFTNDRIQRIAERSEYIEARLEYQLEEFSPFAPLRLTHKPDHASILKALFLRLPGRQFV